MFSRQGSERQTYHQGGALDVLETGVVLDFIGGSQLTTSGDTERKETLIQDGYKIVRREPRNTNGCQSNSRFRSARAA